MEEENKIMTTKKKDNRKKAKKRDFGASQSWQKKANIKKIQRQKNYPEKIKNLSLVVLFLGFIIFGLVNTRWNASISKSWNQFEADFRNYSPNNENSPSMANLGDVNHDNYPDFLIFDDSENNYLIISKVDAFSDGNLSSFDDFLNKSVPYVLNSSLYKKYSNSTIGLYSLVPKYGSKEFIWLRQLEYRDIISLKVVSDANGDGIKDILMCEGVKPKLPDANLFGYNSTEELIAAYPNILLDYFYIDNGSNTYLFTYKYSEYIITLLSGTNGEIIDNSKFSNLKLNNSILEFIEVNTTDYDKVHSNIDSPTEYIALYSNISTARYNIYKRDLEFYWRNDVSFGLLKFVMNPIHIIMSKSPNNYTAGDYVDVPKEYTYNQESAIMNTSMKYASEISLERFGNNFVMQYTANFFDMYLTSYNYFNRKEGLNGKLNVFKVYNSSNLEALWTGNLNVSYLISNKVLLKEQFGQVMGYYNTDLYIYSVLFNPETGVPYSKVKIGNLSDIINVNNVNNLKFRISDDDKMGNDGYLELIILGILTDDNYYREHNLNDKTLIQLARVSQNITSDIQVLKSKPLITEFDNRYSTENVFLKSINVDADKDDWLDYVLISDTYSPLSSYINGDDNHPQILISGHGTKLYFRHLSQSFSLYQNDTANKELDYKPVKFNRKVYFFEDPFESNKLSIVNLNTEGFIYVEDINTYHPNVSFMNFFVGADILIYFFSFLLLVVVILLIRTSMEYKGLRTEMNHVELNEIEDKSDGKRKKVKKSKEDKKDGDKDKDEDLLTRLVRVNTVLLVIIVAVIIYFFVISLKLTIGYTTIEISPEGQLVWFIFLYPASFLLFIVIPEIFNYTAPYFAEKVFINGQRKTYALLRKLSKRDYKIIVIDIVEKKKISKAAIIGRVFLPLLISLTIGITIYQGLGPDGFLIKALYPRFIDHPLTNPDTLGILTPDMKSSNDLWIEIGRFARYCFQPMIYTYIAITLIIPSAWLLDDAGVCYYERALEYREISDVDSISKWTLSFISGLFGVTAIIQFMNLFVPMFSQLGTLMSVLGELAEGSPAFSVLVLILALIIFPILSGVIFIYNAMFKMELNYDKNIKRLYKRMEKIGIDTTPLDLSAVLNAKLPEKRIPIEEDEQEEIQSRAGLINNPQNDIYKGEDKTE
ncbi:MAG: hypothetical protein ACTSU2_06350 [Promethearchaeota archaeon]